MIKITVTFFYYSGYFLVSSRNNPCDMPLTLAVFRIFIVYPTSFRYLYTVGLLNPHMRASSDTFIFPEAKAG